MNRLWVRLTLAMVAVTLFGIGLIGGLAYAGTRAQLDALAEQQRAIIHLDVVDALRDHYELNGSWDGAEGVILANVPQVRLPEPRPTEPRPGGNPGGNPNGQPGRFGPPRGPRGLSAYVLADAGNRIVYDSARVRLGMQLTRDDLDVALPIEVNGRVAGRLIASSPMQLLWLESQQIFFRSVLRSLWIAAIIGGALAALGGLLLSRWLTRPLDDLAKTARAFAGRQWQIRAPSKGTQEVQAVASAFNSMAAGLERAEINRRNLTADIAHELRTPLTVVQGNLRAMLDGVYPMEKQEIATIYDETRLLGRLVEDVRELALAEAGQLTLNVQAVALNAWLARGIEPLHTSAEARGVTLGADIATDAGAVQADPDRATQVLRNLLMNALRHTPEGGRVEVRVTSEATEARIAVIDTGEGVQPEDLPHIFDRFYRADKSRARQTGGSGLGLPISKALVEAMGGRIGVESTPGAGSTFWFTLRR